MRVLPSGDAGLLLECADLDEVARWHAAVRAEPPDGLVDVVPAARTVLLVLDPDLTTPEQAGDAVEGLAPEEHEGAEAQSEVLELAVRYDGEDLEEVAGLLGTDSAEVVRRHTATTWRVAFCGFAPGFGYLVDEEDPGGWSVPRRDEPRTAVPAGSVGLAGEFTGVYPTRSPGGWQLIGRTEREMFDLDRDPPALLVPGTRVRFVEQT